MLAAAVSGASAYPAPAPPDGHAAQDSEPCLPLGGLLVRQTTRRNLADGSEVTERLGGRVYRVTRCDRRGVLRRSMTVAPVADPDGGFVLAPSTIVEPTRVLSLDYGERRDRRWARAWRRVRARIRDRSLPATKGTPRDDPAYDGRNARVRTSTRTGAVARTAAGSSCSDGSNIKIGTLWPERRYRWRWNSKSFGSNYDTRDSLKTGSEAWDRTSTSCDYGDITQITPEYLGSTSSKAGVQDDVSTADKGDVGALGCDGALACAMSWQSDGRAVESDVRFSKDVKWSNSGADGAYDYRSVATHEYGHVIGLSDLYESPNLTMSYQVKMGSTAPRTLGRGDVLGLRDLYP